jgi:hypothetical protein
MDEYEKLEDARKALKEARTESDAAKAGEGGISDDEDKYEYEPDTPGQGYDEKTRTSTRNLRLREDIGSYLKQLLLIVQRNISSIQAIHHTTIPSPGLCGSYPMAPKSQTIQN